MTPAMRSVVAEVDDARLGRSTKAGVMTPAMLLCRGSTNVTSSRSTKAGVMTPAMPPPFAPPLIVDTRSTKAGVMTPAMRV